MFRLKPIHGVMLHGMNAVPSYKLVFYTDYL